MSANEVGAPTWRIAARIVASVNEGGLRGFLAYRYLPKIDKVQTYSFVEKDDIRRNGMAYLSTNSPQTICGAKKTTGLPGPPLAVFYAVRSFILIYSYYLSRKSP